MSTSLNHQFLLATTALLVLFACAYEAALRWPDHPTQPPAAAPTVEATAPVATPTRGAPTARKPHATAEAEHIGWRVVRTPVQRPSLHVHRYVGTIGGRPATAELHWYSPDSVWGRFYLHRREPDYDLSGHQTPSGSLVLSVLPNSTPSMEAGEWRLLGRPGGPVLNALWQQDHQRRRIVLRESYDGAVRYGVRTVWYTDGARGSLVYDFLFLPVPATVARRLRPQLNPSPKARLEQLVAERDSLSATQGHICVRLNDYGLFSYQRDYDCTSTEADAVCGDGLSSFLFDLVRGQPITVESQLRPGYEKSLRPLLARHLSDELVDICFSKALLLKIRPDAGLCLTWNGLEAAYEGPVKCGIMSIAVPYRELRPLVRPGTPLARMLAARGL
jgi:hypothetical protein